MDKDVLTTPTGHEESVFIVSVSGGKDSTATLLAMREAEIPHRAVFADTGWEAPQTYDYLLTLERVLGIRIDRVGVAGGMMARCRHRAGFASRMQRWCTRELKIEPLLAYHEKIANDTGHDTVSVVGIRAEESKARALFAAFGFDDLWGGYVWRPLLRWPVADVIAIHHRHNVPINPLYRLGFSRVGCWPCGPHASKEDVRLWSIHGGERVDTVRALEREMQTLRQARNIETLGRYTYPDDASFFQARLRSRSPSGKRAYTPMSLDDTISWSRTTHGGRQLPILQEPPSEGCYRWGMCDPPTESDDEPL